MRPYTEEFLFPSYGTRVTVVEHDYEGEVLHTAAECMACGALVIDETTHLLWHNEGARP